MKSRNSGLEISSIVMREWRTCLLWAVPFAALLTVAVLLLPKKYASEMKILVNNERQDPIVSTDYTRYTPQPHEESEMQVVWSTAERRDQFRLPNWIARSPSSIKA
jgi:uncharacterized protein involved in exopolysaccharide biosynthesis